MTARATGQLAFSLAYRPALGAGDFFVAPSNQDAVAWIDRWPDWQAPGLVVHGPPGCGKSHLLAVWRAVSDGGLIDAATLAGKDPAALLGSATHLAVERLDALRDEHVLFHLFNMVVERGGRLLLAARQAPTRLQIRLPDLASRVGALPAVAVTEPDDDLLAAVLVKLFADQQIDPAPNLINYLTARMERSFDAARRLVLALDRRALERRRPPSVHMAREVLAMEFGIEE